MKAVHIGFPKTATTFLQKAVFPRLVTPGFVYVVHGTCVRLFESLIDDDDTIYDAAATETRVRECARETETVLFSYEGLTGQPYGSGFVNRSQIARRLKQVGFDRVLITIRNQFDAIESAYKQYVKSGGVLRFRDYVDFDESRKGHLDPRYFDYHLIHDLYSSIFGTANVLVLQYERLREPAFLGSLTRFLSTESVAVEWDRPANESLSFEKIAFLRVCNHFTRSDLRPTGLVSTGAAHRLLSLLPFGNSDRSFHDPRSRAAVDRFFADSNLRFARSAGITLVSSYPGADRGEREVGSRRADQISV